MHHGRSLFHYGRKPDFRLRSGYRGMTADISGLKPRRPSPVMQPAVIDSEIRPPGRVADQVLRLSFEMIEFDIEIHIVTPPRKLGAQA